MLARDLANNFTRKYMELKASGATRQELDNYLDEHSQYRSQHLGEAEGAEICCGQVAGLIAGVQGAGDVMSDVVGALGSRFEELKRKLDALL
jgi:NAD(P)H-dependent flavin oxidoreductase YrpB (nitropropane dioxygenase family)